jgi:hypothetical protein
VLVVVGWSAWLAIRVDFTRAVRAADGYMAAQERGDMAAAAQLADLPAFGASTEAEWARRAQAAVPTFGRITAHEPRRSGLRFDWQAPGARPSGIFYTVSYSVERASQDTHDDLTLWKPLWGFLVADPKVVGHRATHRPT